MLEAGADSGKFLSSNGDGYYFVKLLSKDSTQVNYVSIKVPFSEFNNRMDKIREEGLVKVRLSNCGRLLLRNMTERERSPETGQLPWSWEPGRQVAQRTPPSSLLL